MPSPRHAPPSDATASDTPPPTVDAPITALLVALVVLVPGLVGLATGRVLLFPSLGPTALLQAHTPEHPSARPYPVVVSHLVGVAAGMGAVIAFGLATAPSVFEAGALSPARVGAAVVAVAVATAVEILLRASHPPAASTTLLVALGSFKPTARDVAALVIGVLVVAATGEAGRGLRLRRRGATA